MEMGLDPLSGTLSPASFRLFFPIEGAFCFGLLCLNQNRLHRLGRGALRSDETAVAVELDGGRLDHVRILPEARVSRVEGRLPVMLWAVMLCAVT